MLIGVTSSPLRYMAWTFVSRLNPYHGNFAWLSLVWVALTDLYVRRQPEGCICRSQVLHPARRAGLTLGEQTAELDDGAVVIAAITTCTNTSNPEVMIAAALLTKKAAERGLAPKPWLKTSLAPGSRVVMDYYHRAGLTPWLDKLGFNLVSYGSTGDGTARNVRFQDHHSVRAGRRLPFRPGAARHPTAGADLGQPVHGPPVQGQHAR